MHLCEPGLRALTEESAPLLVPADLLDIQRARRLGGARGRLAHAYRYRRGERGFQQLSWDEALAELGEVTLQTNSRCSETRALVPAAENALADAIGFSESTCDLEDLAQADLILSWRADLSTNPRVETVIAHARSEGAVVAVVGPEAQLTRHYDSWLRLQPDADQLLSDALVGMLDVDRARIQRFTTGFEEVQGRQLAIRDAAEQTGVPTGRIEWLARHLSQAQRVVTLTSSDASLRAIANLHLAVGQVAGAGRGILRLPGPWRDEVVLRRPGLRVHLTSTLRDEMLVDEDVVLLLPASSLHEREGGALVDTCGTHRSWAPQLFHPVGSSRPPWQVLAALKGDSVSLSELRRAHGLAPGPVAAPCLDEAYALPDGLARFA
jgi:anaerobic selenocysteine-containing dehydrogenase